MGWGESEGIRKVAKSNVTPFRRSGKSPRSGKGRTRILLWAVIIAVGGWLAYDGSGNSSGLLALAKSPTADSLSASFSLCGADRHVNCVVDGDTFWFQGEKIRIADIDSPELSPPRCEEERLKGEGAKARLLTLLNAGKFSLSAARATSKYGRKLRTVTRAGHSLRDTLIDEGLARHWDGARHGWCGWGAARGSSPEWAKTACGFRERSG
jgi:endonuclease YncB( thermonuclease family)